LITHTPTSALSSGSAPGERGGRTAFAVVSPLAVPGTYSQTADHYSLLRTIEDGFGITSFLGNAAAVTPINTIWGP